VLDLIDAIKEKNPGAGMDHIHHTLDAGTDPRQFTRQIVDYLRSVLLVNMGSASQVDTTAEVREHMARHAKNFEKPELLRVIHVFNQAVTEARNSWLPSLSLELAFLEALEASSISYQSPPAGSPSNPTPKKSSSPRPKKPTKKTSSGSGVIGMTAKKWSEIFNLVKEESPNTTGLLNASDRELSDGTLILYFHGELLKQKMEQENHLDVLKKAVEKVLEMRVEIRCEIVSGGKNALPSGVDGSGMVATAMRLGGEIVDTNELGAQAEE
jgi:DNA polymerase-3 subunit gamma/tau